MKLILSHPTGNTFVRSVATGMAKEDMLSEFYTTIATFPGSFIDKLSNVRVFSELRRRQYDPILKPFTKAWPWMELGRQISLKSNLSKLVRHEQGIFSVDAIYKNLDKHVATRLKRLPHSGINGVYAYEDGALHSFTEAKSKGIQCFYDLPIGYWRTARKLLEKEKQRWPDWSSTLTGLIDSDAKLASKDEELRLADRIFVASSFTAKSLKDYPGQLAPVEIVPYAFPPVVGRRDYNMQANRKLKLLFVGNLSQRKGIADLFNAVEAFKNHVELTIVGLKVTGDCPVLDASLSKHRWIPSLPHHDILKLMNVHDVFIFPSLFEGFGLVITEAMSQGTPVITTDRTSGPDIIRHNENGWLITAGEPEQLCLAIENVIGKPVSIANTGKAAMETARLRSWKTYEKELTTAIIKHFTANTMYN